MKKGIILLGILALLLLAAPFVMDKLKNTPSEVPAYTPAPLMEVIGIDVPDTGGSHSVVITPSPSPAPTPAPKQTTVPSASFAPAAANHGNTTSSAKAEKGSAFALTIQKQTVQILPSVDEESLEQAPGWLDSSAAPGEEGVCVVYGHRNRKHFRFLKGIDCGDTITVTMPDGTIWDYVVESTEILDSDSALRIPTITGKHLMLTTCYPFYYTGHAPKKFVVIALLSSSI